MRRGNYFVVVLSILLAASISCDSRSLNSGDRVLENFYPGLRVGMRLSDVRRVYPNLRFQPYYGFVADTSSNSTLFGRFGVKVTAPVRQTPPSMSSRVVTFHLFSSSEQNGLTAERIITQTTGRSPQAGCGGQSMAIQVWHWPSPNQNIALLRNPHTADGKQLVLLVISSRQVHPESLVTDYMPGPCRPKVLASATLRFPKHSALGLNLFDVQR
jgi:hypothetical protein